MAASTPRICSDLDAIQMSPTIAPLSFMLAKTQLFPPSAPVTTYRSHLPACACICWGVSYEACHVLEALELALLGTLNTIRPNIEKAARTPSWKIIQNVAQTIIPNSQSTSNAASNSLCGPIRGYKIANCVASESFVLWKNRSSATSPATVLEEPKANQPQHVQMTNNTLFEC